MATTPAVVEKDAEEAEKLMQEIHQATIEDEGNTEESTPSQEEGKADDLQTQDEKQPPEDKQPDEKDYKAEYEKLLHSHSVLQGKYNAEVPRFSQEVSALRQELAELRTKAEQKQAAPAAGKAEENTDADPEIAFLRDEYPDIYGGIIKLMRGSKGESDIAKKVSELETKVQQTEARTVKTEAEKYEGRLSDAVQNWRTINNDPQFIAWLQQKDRYTGYTKFDLLRSAHERADAGTVINFFNDYIAETNSDAAPADDAGGSKPRLNKKDYIAPSSSSKSVNPQQAETFNRKDIDKFYDDVRKGKYIGRDAERLALERKYDLAITGNKVIG